MRVKVLTSAGLAALFFTLGGCASLSRDRRESTDDLLTRLFPAAGQSRSLAGEANVELTYGGRGVSLDAAVALRAPGDFRIDVLDPLDRPVAMIFLRDGRIVQYRPRTSVAASVSLLPRECRAVDAGAWVAYVVGTGPGREGREAFRASWPGARELLRYEGAFLAERIVYGGQGDRLGLEKVEWYCGGDVVMSLEAQGGEPTAAGGGRHFEVAFPDAGLALEIATSALQPFEVGDQYLFQPLLPAATRRVEWHLVHER